jgi:branched-chain amino acid transport system permease protein
MLRIGANNTDWLGAGAGLNLETIKELDRWTRAAGTYWVALLLALLSIVTMIVLTHSAHGTALAAIRDNEDAAASLGIDVERLKRWLFVGAAGMVGACGGVAYINVLQVSPDAGFSLNWTAYVIFIVVIGGIGTIEGPIIGALLFFALRESLSDYGTWYLIGTGLLAALAMMFMPRGLWGTLSKHISWSPLHVRRRIQVTGASQRRSQAGT